MRRIGSAEVTGPIPVSSSARKERKPLNCKGFRFFTFSTCNSFQLCYNDNSLDGDIAQLGERCVRNAKVAGSNPVVSMIEKALKTLSFPLFSRLFLTFFPKRTFEKIQKNKKNSSILNHPML